MVRIGLPNTLRGEIWELTSGAMVICDFNIFQYRRFFNEGYYEKICSENAGKKSFSTEEIEKDLYRSLPGIYDKIHFKNIVDIKATSRFNYNTKIEEYRLLDVYSMPIHSITLKLDIVKQ